MAAGDHMPSTASLGGGISRGVVIHIGAPICVCGVAGLREALARSAERDIAARQQIQATADEFQTLFTSSPVALAFAQDPQAALRAGFAPEQIAFAPNTSARDPANNA